MGRSYEEARRLGLNVEQPSLPPGWPTAEKSEPDAPATKPPGLFDDLAIDPDELRRQTKAAKAPKGFTLAIPGVVTEAQAAKAVRAFAGKSARIAGQQAEDALHALHAHYRACRRAFMQAVPTPVKQVGRRAKSGAFQAFYAARTGVDFVGPAVIGDELVSVALEVKSTVEASIALDRVKETQRVQLDWYAANNCLAAVLVRLPAGWWLVPWQRWHGAPGSRRAKSLTAEDLDVVGVLCRLRPDLHNAPDWLTAAAALETRP